MLMQDKILPRNVAFGHIRPGKAPRWLQTSRKLYSKLVNIRVRTVVVGIRNRKA